MTRYVSVVLRVQRSSSSRMGEGAACWVGVVEAGGAGEAGGAAGAEPRGAGGEAEEVEEVVVVMVVVAMVAVGIAAEGRLLVSKSV